MPKYGEKERAKPYSADYQAWHRAAKNGQPNAGMLANEHTRKHINPVDWDALRARILEEQAARHGKR